MGARKPDNVPTTVKNFETLIEILRNSKVMNDCDCLLVRNKFVIFLGDDKVINLISENALEECIFKFTWLHICYILF